VRPPSGREYAPHHRRRKTATPGATA
jgi:hypothetical protein